MCANQRLCKDNCSMCAEYYQLEEELETARFRLEQDKLLIMKCEYAIRKLVQNQVFYEHKTSYSKLSPKEIKKLEDEKLIYYLSLREKNGN